MTSRECSQTSLCNMTDNMITEVTLGDMLAAREWRAEHQRELISKYGTPVISFTMNIAGPKKTSPLIKRAFLEGVAALDVMLAAAPKNKREVFEKHTGYEAYFSVECDAEAIKEICVGIESATPLGRLFDIDVIDECGEKLTRGGLRRCIICDMPGLSCARSRAHTTEELQLKTEEIITDYFHGCDAKHVGSRAVTALLSEVYTTPKPGLVDLNNSGSHRDMNLGSFERSAAALAPYFEECFKIGVFTSRMSPGDTFRALRERGLLAEREMYLATGGVNTHKGAIYSLGILTGSVGRLWRADTPFAECDEILRTAGDIARDAVLSDLDAASGKTAGERIYLEKGIRGIRGEAAEGFPSVKNIALPTLRELTSRGMTECEAGSVALLRLLPKVEDTTLYRRGGEAGALYASEYAERLTEGGRIPTAEEILKMDKDFTERNLSPGGCADLLALTYFLFNL